MTPIIYVLEVDNDKQQYKKDRLSYEILYVVMLHRKLLHVTTFLRALKFICKIYLSMKMKEKSTSTKIHLFIFRRTSNAINR